MSENSAITSEYFYGMRVAYIDEEELINSLQLSYKQYVVDIVENFEENNPSIDITITLPTLANNETLKNSTPVDINITNLSLGIANIIATGSDTYSGIEFSTLYPQIEYFGLTSQQATDVQEFISDYIVDNNLYSTSETVNMSELLTTTITTDSDLQYIYNICEKVIIKDELATETGLSDIQQRQYIGAIYMPKNDIIFSNSSYSIASESETFNCVSQVIFKDNGSETVKATNILSEQSDIFDAIETQVTLNTFTSIDSENVDAFSTGISLFEALRLSSQYINYFIKDEETQIYSWKPSANNALYIMFAASDKFIFTDFSVDIMLAR
jgi:hypothetical protein